MGERIATFDQLSRGYSVYHAHLVHMTVPAGSNLRRTRKKIGVQKLRLMLTPTVRGLIGVR